MLLESAFNLIVAVQKQQRSEIVRVLSFLEKFSVADAEYELRLDEQKMVFWVNIYNAFFQMKARSLDQGTLAGRSDFFQKKQIDLLGLSLSFDIIEHVILRRSKWKKGLGFISNPFVQKELKSLRVNMVDFRVHFLLNCGATSCPIIYPINPVNYHQVLKNATLGYLEQEVTLDPLNRKIVLNQLFLFYLGDFGGRKGLKNILMENGIMGKNHFHFKFKFIPFNKSVKMDHFIT